MFNICDWICKNLQELKWLNMKATLLHYPDTPMAELQITGSAFTDIISVTLLVHDSPLWSVVPLGSTNKATLGAKLLSATVPA